MGAPALELLRVRTVLVSINSTDETLAWSGIVRSSRGLSDVDPILDLCNCPTVERNPCSSGITMKSTKWSAKRLHASKKSMLCFMTLQDVT